MAKAKKSKEEEVLVEATEEVVKSTDTEVEEKPKQKGKYEDQIVGTGVFQSVRVEGGAILYNPSGVRVSNLESEAVAIDKAARMNSAAGLKPRK